MNQTVVETLTTVSKKRANLRQGATLLTSLIVVNCFGSALAVRPISKSHSPERSRISSSATPTSPSRSATHDKDPIVVADLIIREIGNVEHIEQRIQVGSVGWQEERSAAEKSTKDKLQSAKDRLAMLGPAAAPALVSSLTSSNADVVQICSEVLGQYGSASVLPLIELVKKAGPIANAVRAFQHVGLDCVAPLSTMLSSDDDAQLITALAILDSMLEDTVGGSSRRIYHYHRFNSQTFANANEAQQIVLPMSTVGKICQLGAKDRSIKCREQVAKMLGKIGPRAPIVAESLYSLVNDEQPVVRAVAVNSLGSIACLQNREIAPRSIAVLVEVLKNDDYAGSRREAAAALGRVLAFPDLAVPALSAALNDGYGQVSSVAMQSLCQFGEQAGPSLPTIMNLIKASPDTATTANAFRVIGSMKSAAAPAIPMLCDAISGTNLQRQIGAVSIIESLGSLAAPAVQPLLKRLTSCDGSMRYSILRAFGGIGPQASDAVPVLREIAKSNVRERAIAQQSLLKITGETATEVDSANPSAQRAIVVPVTPPNDANASQAPAASGPASRQSSI